MSMSDKAKQEAGVALYQAKQERDRAEKAREEANKEAKERREAEDKARKAEYEADGTKTTFRSLFIGNIIFAAALAFFQLYDHRSVLVECGKWFADRGKSIAGFVLWLKSIYMGIAHGFVSFKWPVPLCFILTILIFIFIAAALFLLFRWLFFKIAKRVSDILYEYDNGLFKSAVSADIALILFFVCMWFYTPIKAALRLNIFSLWLIFAIVGVLIWNAPEIVRGLK